VPTTLVAGARFVSSLDLDGGELVVGPPGAAKAHVPLATAETMFRAADAVDGTYDFSVMGLGVVTLTLPGSSPPTTGGPFGTAPPGPPGSALTTTTTTPSAPRVTGGPSSTAASGGPSTTARSATTSATASPSPSTSTASGVPSSTVAGTAPGTTTPSSSTTSASAGGAASSLPRYEQRLAWVGVAWNPPCPAGATTAAGTTPSSTPRQPAATSRYTVVLFDARTGRDALAYTSRGPSTCGGRSQGPVVGRPSELVSVPWQPVGPASTAVQVSLPACGTYEGWTELPSPGGGQVTEVVAHVPFDPACGRPASVQVVDDVVPLGTAQSTVSHAPLGPVQAERTLSGGVSTG